jgi:hypothetical protein
MKTVRAGGIGGKGALFWVIMAHVGEKNKHNMHIFACLTGRIEPKGLIRQAPGQGA